MGIPTAVAEEQACRDARPIGAERADHAALAGFETRVTRLLAYGHVCTSRSTWRSAMGAALGFSPTSCSSSTRIHSPSCTRSVPSLRDYVLREAALATSAEFDRPRATGRVAPRAPPAPGFRGPPPTRDRVTTFTGGLTRVPGIGSKSGPGGRHHPDGRALRGLCGGAGGLGETPRLHAEPPGRPAPPLVPDAHRLVGNFSATTLLAVDAGKARHSFLDLHARSRTSCGKTSTIPSTRVSVSSRSCCPADTRAAPMPIVFASTIALAPASEAVRHTAPSSPAAPSPCLTGNADRRPRPQRLPRPRRAPVPLGRAGRRVPSGVVEAMFEAYPGDRDAGRVG